MLNPNANFSIDSTLAGIETDANESQDIKAASPIVITLSGITTLSSHEHELNALLPIYFTLSGITIFSILQP